MRHRIVVRFANGEVLKGFTEDLFPGKASFHLELADDSGDHREVTVADLKAVFFVKSFAGDRHHRDLHEGERAGYGKKIRVVFRDGEEIVGYTSGYSAERPVFFVFPVDPESNNDRILVVNGATTRVEFI